MVSLKKNNFLYTLLILLLMNGMMSLFAQQQTAGVKTIVRYDPLSGLYIFEKENWRAPALYPHHHDTKGIHGLSVAADAG